MSNYNELKEDLRLRVEAIVKTYEGFGLELRNRESMPVVQWRLRLQRKFQIG